LLTTTDSGSVRTHVLRAAPYFLLALVLMLAGSFVVRAAVSKEVVRDHHYMLAKATADSLSGHVPVDFAAKGGPTLERLVNSPEPDWLPDYRPAGWERFDLGQRPTLDWRTPGFDTARKLNAAIPDSVDPLHAAQPFVLHASASEYHRAVQCLAAAVHYEAGNEPVEGQEAVAQVVLNRMRTPGYPKSICGVVFQGAERPGCQFSFACDGSMNRIPAAWAWKNAEAVATRALNGFVLGKVGDATHYHATYVLPWWSPTLVKLGRIGQHVFYRPTGPAAFAPYAGGELSITKANYIGKPQPASAPARDSVDAVTQMASLTTTPDGRVHATIMDPSQITVSNVPMVDGKAVMPTVHALISARAAYAKAQMQARATSPAAKAPTPALKTVVAPPPAPAPTILASAAA
jgi:spore germination cell wall hydrolase CwlJ-like protein